MQVLGFQRSGKERQGEVTTNLSDHQSRN